MNYNTLTKEALIAIIGEQNGKIDELLKSLENAGIEIVALKNSPNTQSQQVEAVNHEGKDQNNLIKQLTNENQDLKDNLEEAEGIIADLKLQLEQVNQQVESLDDRIKVTYKGTTYQAVLPRFNHNGVAYEAKDLKTNPALAAELIEEKMGVLKPVK